MERRLAAILAADVMGYARHTEHDEEASTTTLRTYRAIVEESISTHRGHIFSSAGDGLVAEFPSIVETIRCAIEIQNEIAERNAAVPEDDQMQFRIGVNLGDVVAEDSNVYGTGVNVAVRLEQLAEPGGICISQTVYEQVRKIVEIPFEDIGERRLKNIADPIRVYRIRTSPLPWLKDLLSRSTRRRGFSAVMGALFLVLAATAAAFYLNHPAVFWDTLSSVGGEPKLPERSTIAVMPFHDLSATGDQEYLADGIAEDLIIGFAKFPDLIVMARNSSFAYKGTNTDTRKVGKELDVRYVVEGTIQRVDQNVRVTAQLNDATTGHQLWSDRYDRQVDSIFGIRDDITQAIAGTLGGLQGKLAQAEMARVSGKDPTSFTAYDYLTKGWYEWYKFTQSDNEAARNLFEQARQADPNYARAYAGLAWTYANDYDFEWTEDYDGTVKRALEMASTGVRLDPDDYQAHWALGWAHLYSREHDEAMASYVRARELNPNDAELLAEMANMLVYVGQQQQAIDQLKKAIRLNPFHDPWYVEYLGWAYEEAGMPQEAVQTLEQVVDLKNVTEEQAWVLPTLAAAYANPSVGRMNKAQEVLKTILSRQPNFSISDVVSRCPYKTKEQIDRYVNALQRAGLPDKAAGQ